MQNDKIKFLVRLQLLDNELFDILGEQRGLPEEIDELRTQAKEYATILAVRRKRKEENDVKMKLLLAEISDLQSKIKKFKEQQTTARNNKEYDALSKQIEFAEIEIKKSENQVRALEEREAQYSSLEEKGKGLLDESRYDELTDEMLPTDYLLKRLTELEKESSEKETELNSIIAETQADIDALNEKIKTQRAVVLQADRSLLAKYDVLRSSNIQNAVVKFYRNACNGCNSRIPASKHSTLHQGGFYACESCGRIVVHEQFFETVPTD